MQLLASWVHWAVFAGLGLLVGATKAGLAGIAVVLMPVVATMVGGRVAAGLVLPLLIFGDVMAVLYYRRSARWDVLLRLLPWSISGVVVGTLVGGRIDDSLFRALMGVFIVGSMVVLAVRTAGESRRAGERMRDRSGDRGGEGDEGHESVTDPLAEAEDGDGDTRGVGSPTYVRVAAIALGLLGGFATMVGNAAGGIMSLYLVLMGLKKREFIGTGAWFYLIVNVIKVPFHVLAWGTITGDTLLADVLVFGAIVVGFFAGRYVVHRLNERAFRWFVIIATSLSAVFLFF